MIRKGRFVAVVDGDKSVREALPDLLRQLGYRAEGFRSAREFLASDRLERTDCLVLDIATPAMSGFDLPRELIGRGLTIPVIVITTHGDVVRLRARRWGAAAFLLKPFSDTALLEALQAASGGTTEADSEEER